MLSDQARDELLYTLSAPPVRVRPHRVSEPAPKGEETVQVLPLTLSAPNLGAGTSSAPHVLSSEPMEAPPDGDFLLRPLLTEAKPRACDLQQFALPLYYSAPGTRERPPPTRHSDPQNGRGGGLSTVVQVDSDDCSDEFPPPLAPESPQESAPLTSAPPPFATAQQSLDCTSQPSQARRRRRSRRTARKADTLPAPPEPSPGAEGSIPDAAVPWVNWVDGELRRGGGAVRLSKLRSRLCSYGGRLANAEPFRAVAGGAGVARAEAFLRRYFTVREQEDGVVVVQLSPEAS